MSNFLVHSLPQLLVPLHCVTGFPFFSCSITISFCYIRIDRIHFLICAIMTQATPEEVNRAVSKDLKARGITQQQAADTIGKSRSMVANQLSSKKRFSKQLASLFYRAFGYST